MASLGTLAPDFTLNDVVIGRPVSLSSFASKKALLVMFICRHCPYVQHIKQGLSRLDKDYRSKDIAIVAVSSNDAENYPDDAPESLKALSLEQDWHFSFLYDPTQEVAKRYRAACTPDFFLYNANRELVYRGQLDDSRPGNDKQVTGKDLREAIEAVLTDKLISKTQRASIGCNIKWKKGNAPSYFQS
jgi:thiol-disulfide isomerase/thioredoxin